MDWLLEVEGELAEQGYWATASLLNLEVDLLFFDATSTYFETEAADEPFRGMRPGASAPTATRRTTARHGPCGLPSAVARVGGLHDSVRTAGAHEG